MDFDVVAGDLSHIWKYPNEDKRCPLCIDGRVTMGFNQEEALNIGELSVAVRVCGTPSEPSHVV